MKFIFPLLLLTLILCSKKAATEMETPIEALTNEQISSASAKAEAKNETKNTTAEQPKEITADPWENERTYEEGDTVKQDDRIWIANRKVYQNTPPPNEWFWRPLSGSSDDKNSYNAGLTYDSGNVVVFKGKKYKSRRKVFLNTTPEDTWFWEEITD